MTFFLSNLKKNWDIDDSPQLWKNAIEDPYQFATWKEVEHCLNNPHFFDMHLVDKVSGVYIDYPKFERSWSYPCADAKQLMDIFADGHTLIINNFGQVNADKTAICAEIEKFFPEIRASLHIYCGLSDSKSFKIHEDYANNFILQVEGETHWKVYNNRASNIVGQIDYDIIEDDGRRLKFLCDEIDRLHNKPIEEIHELYLSVKDKLIHNRKVFLDLADKDCWTSYFDEVFK